MHGGDLDDRAAGGYEPVKTFALRESGDGPAVRRAFRHADKRLQVTANLVEIDGWPQRANPVRIQVRANPEKFPLRAKQDDAGVEKLLTLDPRNDANGRVIKGWR